MFSSYDFCRDRRISYGSVRQTATSGPGTVGPKKPAGGASSKAGCRPRES
ncbi:MAG TPA: hypothetical protein VF630_09630 [Hymenobacter sp.]